MEHGLDVDMHADFADDTEDLLRLGRVHRAQDDDGLPRRVALGHVTSLR